MILIRCSSSVPLAAAADIAAKVDALAVLYADAKVKLLGLAEVDVDVSAFVDLIVKVNVDLCTVRHQLSSFFSALPMTI